MHVYLWGRALGRPAGGSRFLHEPGKNEVEPAALINKTGGRVRGPRVTSHLLLEQFCQAWSPQCDLSKVGCGGVNETSHH